MTGTILSQCRRNGTEEKHPKYTYRNNSRFRRRKASEAGGEEEPGREDSRVPSFATAGKTKEILGEIKK